MKIYCFLLCIAVLVCFGCRNEKKKLLTGEEPVEVADFIEFFPEKALPVVVADTLLNKKEPDSAQIAYTVYKQFAGDSVILKDFGKTQPKLYPLARTKEKGKETYLFLKAVSGSKRVAYLMTFDKKDKFLNMLPIIKSGFETYSSAYGSLDKKFQISTYQEKKTKTGEANFKRNIFIYNSASNDFTLILTEPNVEFMEAVLNPIDTLPQKNKYTGDYQSDKKNLASFRDGRTPSEVLFFVHFEKDKGECKGELKGTARFTSAKKAYYKESGNPCTLEFTFSTSSVVMKEIEGCGSYRDIKCFFEGRFPRKKSKTKQNSK